ncbi:MAG: hypothetical protein HPY46_11835 [Candidatus Aminicenantes bacterium]|nr:hypothetical protein [Candidatus Aminicenantes bacterium]
MLTLIAMNFIIYQAAGVKIFKLPGEAHILCTTGGRKAWLKILFVFVPIAGDNKERNMFFGVSGRLIICAGSGSKNYGEQA